MIIVHGTIPIRAERRERALELARRMTEATLIEAGCISYEFFIGLSDPNTLMLFQEWDTMEALMAHYQTDHMDEFLRELPEVVSGEIATRRYLVQSVEEEAEDSSSPPPVIH